MSVTPEQLAKNGTEDCHQSALFCWASLPDIQARFPQFKRLLHSIPNGGKRDKITAAKLKITGTKAGVPDIFLAVARGPYHGLYIELKKIGGPVRPGQIEFINEVQKEGYAAGVSVGWEAARDVLIWYMNL